VGEKHFSHDKVAGSTAASSAQKAAKATANLASIL
jgi:hypothetical protein